MGIFTVIAIFVVLIFILNNYFLNYWRRRGIPQNDPAFLIGDIKDLFKGKSTMYDVFTDMYRNNKQSKIFGLYLSYRPVLLINDPELVQDVLVKDFNIFHDRGLAVNEESDPLSGHIFSLCGQKWRDVRAKLTPAFSSGKLKGMYPTIRDSIKALDEFLVQNVKNGQKVFEFRDLLARCTTDIITSVAFGVESNCINDKNSIFREFGARIFEKSASQTIKGSLMLFCPKIFSHLKLRAVPRHTEDFITSIVEKTVEYREKNNVERKDLMQLLIQLKNNGYVSVDRNEESMESSEDIRKFTMNEIAAQVYLFFIGGFETSSSTMSFCLYELCKNQEIQRKVHEEIDSIMKKTEGGDISYDTLNDFKYLDCCIDETIRKYPILPYFMRQTMRDYTFSGTNMTIEKDTLVFIPALALHRDPDIFENPMEFRPERFLNSPTGEAKLKGLSYLPFGDGPRKCIGARMGKIQTKLGLAMILSKFSLEFADAGLNDMKYDITNHFLLTPDMPFNFKVTPRY